MRIEIGVFFVRGVEIGCVRAESDSFLVWCSIDLVLASVVAIDLGLDAGSKYS